MRNSGLKFLCRKQHLRVERTDTAYASGYRPQQVIAVGIAHGEGNYMAEAEVLRSLEGDGQVAFRYCDAEGRIGGKANPNGSMNDIAGVYSANLRVLGLMPHPENHVEAQFGGTDGLPLFQSLVRATASTAATAVS
jgi:phosphoribosylformylglycinamidine synthase